MIRAPLEPATGATELRLTVEFNDDAEDALLRVLSTLHRRRCRVTAAEFASESASEFAAGFASDRAAAGRLALRIEAPAGHAGRVGHWLNSLVDVRHVSATSAPASGSASGSGSASTGRLATTPAGR
jgi:acetolactate synthase regulatory subunit